MSNENKRMTELSPEIAAQASGALRDLAALTTQVTELRKQYAGLVALHNDLAAKVKALQNHRHTEDGACWVRTGE